MDGGLFKYIEANGYLHYRQDCERNIGALSYVTGGQGASALTRRNIQLVQTGFGHTRDADLRNTQGWSDHPKKFQCRFPSASATQPVAKVYDVPPGMAKRNWDGCATLENQLMLDSDNNNSTAPGDSGGPLFATSTGNRGDTIDLVGLTSGANFMADIVSPAQAPVDATIDSNCSAYVDQLIEQEKKYLPSKY